MPVTYQIDKRRHLVITEWTGAVTLKEVRAHHAALRADADFDPSMSQLSDAREAKAVVPSNDLRLLAKESPFGKGSRRAVVGRSDLVFGVSRMYQTLIDPDAATVGVFRNIREAYDWLGIDIEEVAEG